MQNNFIISTFINYLLILFHFFRFLLYDCDPFTRNYFKEIFHIVQPDSVKIFEPKDDYQTVYKKVMSLNNNSYFVIIYRRIFKKTNSV